MAGATGSRLLSGNLELFDAFETEIAKDKGMEDALILNSGYHSNAGILECIADKKTFVIFDKLNHASMYQGVFASGAKLLRFHHLDYGYLEEILQQNADAFPRIIVVADFVHGSIGGRYHYYSLFYTPVEPIPPLLRTVWVKFSRCVQFTATKGTMMS